MAKDYAKRVFTTTRKPKKKRLRREFFVVFALLFTCFLGYEIFKQRNTLFFTSNSWLAHIKIFFASQTNLSHKSNQFVKSNSHDSSHVEPAVHFDFYNELPNMQVSLPEKVDIVEPKVTTKISNPQAPVKKELAYIIQFGLFKDVVGAGQLRLSLLLSGVEAEIVNIKTDSGEVFRVQRGPFVNQAEAKKLQHQFLKKGIMGVLKKV